MKEEILLVLKNIKELGSVETLYLEALFTSFFEKATEFNFVRSNVADMPSGELLAQQIDACCIRLEEAKVRVATHFHEIDTITEELKSLEDKRKELEAALHRKKICLGIARANVDKIEDENVALTKSFLPIGKAKNRMSNMKAELEAVHDELKNLTPF